MTTTDPAVQVAAEALGVLAADDTSGAGYGPLHETEAEVAVAAARPSIEAEVRAEVAAAIRAEAQRLDALTITHQDRTAITVLQIKREATEAAARIAEGTDR